MIDNTRRPTREECLIELADFLIEKAIELELYPTRPTTN